MVKGNGGKEKVPEREISAGHIKNSSQWVHKVLSQIAQGSCGLCILRSFHNMHGKCPNAFKDLSLKLVLVLEGAWTKQPSDVFSNLFITSVNQWL